jgi:hypothetical protein
MLQACCGDGIGANMSRELDGVLRQHGARMFGSGRRGEKRDTAWKRR